MFETHHEQELGEIKALEHELCRGAREAQEQLHRIIRQQERRLASRDRRDGSSRLDAGDGGPFMAFVHIPKTAGGTATTVLSRAYSRAGLHRAGNYVREPGQTLARLGRASEDWDTWRRRAGRMSIGHVPYGVFREHLPPTTRYMTFLREPVARVLSHYYRHVHHPELSATQRAERRRNGKSAAGSLEEALVELQLPQLTNLCTRFLCGHPSPMRELPPSALDDAKANLREFAFVGVQERFEESIVLLERMLGLGLIPFFNRHVSVEGKRPTVEEITDEQRALIEGCNRLDAELHAFGTKLFEDDLAAEGDGFADDVRRLTALSADTSEEEIRKLRHWLDYEASPGIKTEPRALRLAAKEAGHSMTAYKAYKEVRYSLKTGGVVTTMQTTDGGHESEDTVDPLLAFVHVPRAAGTTVKLILLEAYGDGVQDVGGYGKSEKKVARKLNELPGGWESWNRRGGRVAVGQVPYALFREHLPAGTRYMTFLREPVNRVLSQYHSKTHKRDKGRRAGTPTADWLDELRGPHFSDLATQFLCGQQSSMGELSASALEDAKANLREFAFIGLQERFEESIVLLRRMLGLRVVPHLNDCVSIDRPTVDEISEDERALIEEWNRRDAELYAFAADLFEDAVAARGAGFADDVEELRASSAVANDEAVGTARDWLEHELPAGETKPTRNVLAAAEVAGVAIPALKHVLDLASVKVDRRADGTKVFTRPEVQHGDRH
jgi:hypothetical protein